jgi:hypothetical protein
MVVLAIVAVVSFVAGMWAATYWLPPLAPGSVGTVSYFLVCGLAGGSLAIAGVRIWQIVHSIERTAFPGLGESEFVAEGIVGIVADAGPVVALAMIAYLLAPKDTSAGDPA